MKIKKFCILCGILLSTLILFSPCPPAYFDANLMPEETLDDDMEEIVVTMFDSARKSGQNPVPTAEPSDTKRWSYTIMINGKVFCHGRINDYFEEGYLYSGKPLIDDPTASIDSLSPTIYEIDLLGRRLQFDVTKNDCIEKIRKFNQPIRGFSRYDTTAVAHYGSSDKEQKTVFHLTIDYPNADIRQQSEICDWLIGNIGYSKYVGRYADIPSFGKSLIDNFIGGMQETWEKYERKEEFSSGDFDCRIDCRARVYNGRYVTYRLYLISYSWHRFGWDEYLISYDLVNHRPVTEDVLFKPDKMEQVSELYLDAVSQYLGFKPIIDYPLYYSDPALSLEGIMFHVAQWPLGPIPIIKTNESFLVPYDKIRQYLTSQTLSLICNNE